MPYYTGAELRLRRMDRGLTQTAVARAMGVDTSRVSVIEARAVVPTKAALRFLDALDKAQASA